MKLLISIIVFFCSISSYSQRNSCQIDLLKIKNYISANDFLQADSIFKISSPKFCSKKNAAKFYDINAGVIYQINGGWVSDSVLKYAERATFFDPKNVALQAKFIDYLGRVKSCQEVFKYELVLLNKQPDLADNDTILGYIHQTLNCLDINEKTSNILDDYLLTNDKSKMAQVVIDKWYIGRLFNWNKALSLTEKLRGKYPNNEDYYLIWYDLKNKYIGGDGIFEFMESGIEPTGYSKKILTVIQDDLLKKQDYNQLLKICERYILHDPNEVQYLYLQAFLLKNLGEDNLAIEKFDSVLLEGNVVFNDSIMDYCALQFFIRGKFKESLRFIYAKGYDHSDVNRISLQAYNYFYLGRFELSYQLLEELKELGVKDSFVDLLLAIIESQYGDYKKSNYYLEQVLFNSDHQKLANMVRIVNSFMLEGNEVGCEVFLDQFQNNIDYILTEEGKGGKSVSYRIEGWEIKIQVSGCTK
jgi:hypothetical protein